MLLRMLRVSGIVFLGRNEMNNNNNLKIVVIRFV